MPNQNENIQALRRGGGFTPDVLTLVGDQSKLIPLLDLIALIPAGEVDLTDNGQYKHATEALEDKRSPEYALALSTTIKALQGDQIVLGRLSGALDPVLVAEIATGLRELAKQQYSLRSSMGSEATILPSQREYIFDAMMEDVRQMAGFEIGEPRSHAMKRFARFAVRAMTHPRKTLAGYVDAVAGDLGMDTPTAFFLTSGSVQKVEAAAEAMRMSASSTDTLQRLEGKIATGAEVEAVVSAMDVEVYIEMKDGFLRKLEFGVGECMDFFYGNFGDVKRDSSTGEPLYKNANGQTKRASQLNAQERANENLQPILSYSPFEPKKFLAEENEWSNQPGEKLLTMSDFAFVDRSARDWVEFLADRAGVDPSNIRAVDVDVPVGYSPAYGPNLKPEPRRDAAADMKPLFVEWDESQPQRTLVDAHPRVRGLIEELKTRVPPLSPQEIDHEVGQYMLYESIAVRFAEIKKIALAMFDVGNETVLFDPAQRKSEVPDPMTKAIGNLAYLDKYQLFQMDVRQLMLAMYAPVTGQKEGFWPISRALEGKKQHLRFREPLGIGKWPELKSIFPDKTPSEAKTIIKDVFFARRRHRGNITSDYIRANEIVKSSRNDASIDDVTALVKAERQTRVAEFNQRSPVLIPRSRQDMYAMLMAMSAEQRRTIANVDFRGYLESIGYQQMNLPAEEYRGWFGLLKAVEGHSFKEYDYGETHKLFVKQIKYLTDAGQNFYALMELAKQMINSLNEQWKKWTGVDSGRLLQGWKPDQLSQAALKELVDVGTMVVGMRTAGMAQEYFGKVIEAVAKVADISFQGPIGQREILMNTIELLDVLVGHFESRTNYEVEDGQGEPGTKRKWLELDLSSYRDVKAPPEIRLMSEHDVMAARALRGAGFRVVVPGNFLKPYVTTGDGTPVYSITGKWDASQHRWIPDKVKKDPLSVFRHIGREAALRSVLIMYAQDQGLLTAGDEEILLQELRARK